MIWYDMIIYIYIILWNFVKYIKKSLKYVLIHDTWSREILWPNCQGAIAWCWGGTSNWHDNWSPCLADLAENMAENTTATGHLSDSVSMPLACPQEWCPNQSTSERRSSAAILALEPQSSLLGLFVLTLFRVELMIAVCWSRLAHHKRYKSTKLRRGSDISTHHETWLTLWENHGKS